MQGLSILFKSIFTGLKAWWSFIPMWFAAVFLLLRFFLTLISEGPGPAFLRMATELFAAEYNIHQQVHLAVTHSSEYGFIAFFSILNSLVIIYYFLKIMTKIFEWVTGSVAIFGSFLMAILFLGIVELSVIRAVNGVWFIPIWDGLIFLLFNLKPVFMNIAFFQWVYHGGSTVIKSNTTEKVVEVVTILP